MASDDKDNKPTISKVLQLYQSQLADTTQLWHSESVEHLDSYSDLLEYLASKGSRHAHYRHYVSRERAMSILDDCAFYLTDGSGWNDRFDAARFNPWFSSYKHYGICFSSSTSESIAMWMHYGGSDRNGVMIDFTSSILLQAISLDSYECGHFEDGRFVKVLDIDREEIDLKLVDVLYFRTDEDKDEVIVFRIDDDKQVSFSRRELDGIQQVTKHDSWSYEKEVRLVARIDKISLHGKGSRATCVRIPLRLPEDFCDTRVYDSPVSDGAGGHLDSHLLGTVEWDLCDGCR